MIDLLQQYGEALFGSRFQRELAKALEVNERTMRRWIAGDTEPPEAIRFELDALARQRIKALERLLKA